MNVFLTPDLRPFFGGTYFPPDSRPGGPGLLQILPWIERSWVEQRSAIEQTGAQVMQHLAVLCAPDSGSSDRLRLFDFAYATFERSEDVEYGGLGNAPAHFGHRERSDRSIVNSQIGIVNTERQVRGRSGATPGCQASS